MSFSVDGEPAVVNVRPVPSAVEDPELGLDTVSLDLVHAVEREGDHVRVVYTLTSMGCPLGPVIEREICEALVGVEGAFSTEVELVFEPPWSLAKMSDGARFLREVYG